ncbi:UNVERIFIED_CONTAM: hypothetical protein Slati_4175800 [Sesamum latifolium]|uniref:Uncharacterized protein n=1 Tax=Sesamum latifolium TaxID=2727402 RepID=A0AAW2T9L3_9LAMI
MDVAPNAGARMGVYAYYGGKPWRCEFSHSWHITSTLLLGMMLMGTDGGLLGSTGIQGRYGGRNLRIYFNDLERVPSEFGRA